MLMVMIVAIEFGVGSFNCLSVHMSYIGEGLMS